MAKRPAKKPAKAKRPATKPSKPKAHPKPAAGRKAEPVAKAKPAAARPAPVYRAAIVPPPPPPLATPKPPAAEAVSVFERGMAELQHHNYPAAKTTFQSLLERFPSEGFLTDRARVYLQLADRELSRRPASSGSVEERLTAATAALNNNDEAEAGRLAESAFKDDPNQDLAAYLLAIVAARQGRTDEALAQIKTAIRLNPESRLQARQDEEFDVLLDLDEFHALTEAPPAPAPAPPMKKPLKRGR